MAWYNAAVAWLEKNYPGIKPVQDKPYEDANDDAKARSNALEILKAYPDLDGMLSCSVSAGSNMAQVLKEKNITSVTLSQLTLPSVAGPYIEEGWIYSGQSWQPAGAGYAANTLALMILKGEDVKTSTTACARMTWMRPLSRSRTTTPAALPSARRRSSISVRGCRRILPAVVSRRSALDAAIWSCCPVCPRE